MAQVSNISLLSLDMEKLYQHTQLATDNSNDSLTTCEFENGWFGNNVELLSPVAKDLFSLGVTEAYDTIKRICDLRVEADCNIRALDSIILYLDEVRQLIQKQEGNIIKSQVPKLVRALKEWERFLVHYTKAKIKVLSRFDTISEVSFISWNR